MSVGGQAGWGLGGVQTMATHRAPAHKWADELHNPCRPGVPKASERGTKSEAAHKWAD